MTTIIKMFLLVSLVDILMLLYIIIQLVPMYALKVMTATKYAHVCKLKRLQLYSLSFLLLYS